MIINPLFTTSHLIQQKVSCHLIDQCSNGIVVTGFKWYIVQMVDCWILILGLQQTFLSCPNGTRIQRKQSCLRSDGRVVAETNIKFP